MSADPHGGAGAEAPMRSAHTGEPDREGESSCIQASLLFCPSGAKGAKFSRTPAIDYVAMTSQPVDDV